MSERDIDDLFRGYGNVRPYYGSFEWSAEGKKNRQARQIYQDLAQRIKNWESWCEEESKAQLAALGYIFEPWYIDGWHR